MAEISEAVLLKPKGKRLKKPRFIQAIYAFFHGYYWLSCDLCGKKYGGHESLDNCCVYSIGFTDGRSVCPDCFEDANKRNQECWKLTYPNSHNSYPTVEKIKADIRKRVEQCQ